MLDPKMPLDEVARLEGLEALQIVHTPPEEPFDRMVRVAARALGAPMAYLSFIDRRREWFKAGHGWNLRELPREDSLADLAIQEAGPIVIADLAEDPRFPEHVLWRQSRVRSYAACPVRGPTGGVVGVLAVLDERPGRFGRASVRSLTDLARTVEDELALRAGKGQAAWRAALDAVPVAAALLDGDGIIRYRNPAWDAGASDGGLIDPDDQPATDHVARLHRVQGPRQEGCGRWAQALEALIQGRQTEAETAWRTPDGRSMRALARRLDVDPPVVLVLHLDRTSEARRVEVEAAALEAALRSDDLRAEQARRERLLRRFRQEADAASTPLALELHVLLSQAWRADDPKRQAALRRIDRSLRRWREAGRRLEQDLQAPAGGDGCRLDDVLAEAVAAARNRALPLGIEVADRPSETHLDVALPSHAVRRLVDGLLERGLALTPSGGRVEVAWRRELDEAVVEVLDGGAAPEGDPEALFEPRVASLAGGGDAALLHMRAAVEHAAGMAWASPGPVGTGTSIGFRLPLA